MQEPDLDEQAVDALVQIEPVPGPRLGHQPAVAVESATLEASVPAAFPGAKRQRVDRARFVLPQHT